MSAIQPPWAPEFADPDPITQFSVWFSDARDVREPEPEAMVVATVDADGVPAARYVLCKGWDERGFVFYTNEHSAKGVDLLARPRASLVWRWYHLERQVRVAGPVGAVTGEESDAYFASRPRGSQIGAWASDQSEVIADRGHLEARIAGLEERYDGAPVPRPPHWRGFRVAPHSVEFWQGRRDRVHDRVRYRRNAAGDWIRERLAP